MNIDAYDKNVRTLYDEHRKYLQFSDPRTIRVLNKLLRIAKQLNDHELIGYTYHSLAFAEYFINGNYPRFLKNMRLSAEHLFRCDDPSELIHVYYMIAIDALNKGMYDIAYNYFLTAANIAQETGQETSAAILDENIGHVLLQIGAYQESRKFMRRALAGIKKDKSHPHYFNNMLSGIINDGVACFQAGLSDQARAGYEKAVRFYETAPDAFTGDSRFNLALFGTQLAIVEEDPVSMHRCMEKTLTEAKDLMQIANYVNDIRRLCDMLLKEREYDAVGNLLQTLEKRGVAPDAANAMRILIDLKIDYYTAAGKKEALDACYPEQDRAYARLLEEQKDVYRFVKDLIALIDTLQKEQEAVSREREELVHRAETDELCGIANRYALNNRLERAFERSLKKQIPLTVCIADLDDLKNYNDRFGHPAGDRLLKSFGDTLRRIGEETGIFVSRYGGDEFVLIGERMTEEDMREAVDDLKNSTGVRFSYGICHAVPDEKVKSWDFLAQADEALYAAKHHKHH